MHTPVKVHKGARNAIVTRQPACAHARLCARHLQRSGPVGHVLYTYARLTGNHAVSMQWKRMNLPYVCTRIKPYE